MCMYCDSSRYLGQGSLCNAIGCLSLCVCVSFVCFCRCLPCEEKYFCPNQSTVVLTPCTAGGYCPPGSSQPLPCPAGTFSSSIGLANSSQCEQCSPGQYCPSSGLTAPVGGCAPGYFCSGCSNTSTPTFGVCPVGHYCPQGTGTPIPCPTGRYGPSTHAANTSDCPSCPGGSYCSISGSSSPQGNCSGGYYCAGGSDTATPSYPYLSVSTGGLCPTGSFCPTGSSGPVPCSPGSYTNTTGAAVCATCPSRYYCPTYGMSSPLPCPAGSYCPSGTASAVTNCPNGTFSNVTLVRYMFVVLLGSVLTGMCECDPCVMLIVLAA